MKLTKEEQIKVLEHRITEEVTAGGGSGYYKQVSYKKLAEVLWEIMSK